MLQLTFENRYQTLSLDSTSVSMLVSWACVAVWCSVLQRVAVCCRVLQCVAGCCSVTHKSDSTSLSMLLSWACVAVC